MICVLAGGEGAGLYSVGLAEIGLAATNARTRLAQANWVTQAIRTAEATKDDTRNFGQQKRSFIWQRLQLSRK